MGGLLNLCANNYLGLADHPAVIEAARDALERWGFGMASVRFICGTQTLHKQLEERLSEFLGTEDDDPLQLLLRRQRRPVRGTARPRGRRHLGRAQPRLDHRRDPALQGAAAAVRERRPGRARGAARGGGRSPHTKMIATDGVFSMDGHIADLQGICDLAERHDALVMVDDSHAVGFVGPNGRGTPELHGVTERVDIVTGTLGKAMGGASGGYVSGRREIVELLRQRARPYLFSNSVAPPIAAAGLKAIELVEGSPELRERLWANTARFRAAMGEAGFDDRRGHPPDRAGDDGRSRRRCCLRRAALGARRLRRQLLVPGRARGRPGSGRSSRRRTPSTTSTSPWPSSWRSGTSSAEACWTPAFPGLPPAACSPRIAASGSPTQARPAGSGSTPWPASSRMPRSTT